MSTEVIRLSTTEISKRYSIPIGTLTRWRFERKGNKRLPRYHKLCTGKVFYVLSEFEEDFLDMEEDVA